MKALVYTAPHQLQWQDVPKAQAAQGEVVLRIDAAGICGSDMHAYHGKDPRRNPGLILGHEFAGTVVETKSNTFHIGQRVTGNPLIRCTTCCYCLEGRDNLCKNRTMVGMTRAGAFAEYMSIPAQSLLVLPPHMPSTHAALTEPAATALHAVRLCMPHLHAKPKDIQVLILGGGAIGLLCACVLVHQGVCDMYMAEVNVLRAQTLRNHTNATVYNPLETSPKENAIDLVVDAVGTKATRNIALQSVKPGGVIMHIGLQDWASEIDMRKLTLSEITLLGAYTYTHDDLQAALDLLANGLLGDPTSNEKQTSGWVHTYSLQEGAKAFALLDSGQTSAAKIVLQ